MNRAGVFLRLTLTVFVVAALSAAADTRVFTGTITDDMCPKADHSQMRMGSTDAECAQACADAHGATYVLFDGKAVYALNDQQTAARFAGRRVKVVGTLAVKANAITVDSITAAN